VSPRALRHHTCHLSEKDSGVVTCPKASSPSPGRRGLRSHHVPRGCRLTPCAGRLWPHHVTEAPGPPPRRAPVMPHVLWLQTRLLAREGSGATTCPVALDPWVCPCIPKMPDIRLIMASPGTRYRHHIKCVCDRPYAVYGKY
jgi:hypothetical protein